MRHSFCEVFFGSTMHHAPAHDLGSGPHSFVVRRVFHEQAHFILSGTRLRRNTTLPMPSAGILSTVLSCH